MLFRSFECNFDQKHKVVPFDWKGGLRKEVAMKEVPTIGAANNIAICITICTAEVPFKEEYALFQSVFDITELRVNIRKQAKKMEATRVHSTPNDFTSTISTPFQFQTQH